jgi:cysteinyl-tRNA synthetase
MEIKLFNSLSKKKETFVPITSNQVTMYVCGPTVYNRPHIGNARSVLIYDLWFRLFLKLFKKVTYVRNITDVDDKINAAALERNISIQVLTEEIIGYFYQDIAALNALNPTKEPRATNYIPQMVKMIQTLIDNGHAYEAKGHVLFDIKSYKKYGELSNRDLSDMISGSRVEIADYKKDPLDFVLWKPAGKNDDTSSIFDSPWSKGRPGWHIECSAMSKEFFGDNFDIHGGGADLQFPHHENEIAQSKCANSGSFYAKYWVHNGFLTVNGEKMSKSSNNFITVKSLLEKKIPGIVIRYLLLLSHYRKPLDFNDKSLIDAKKSIQKFYYSILDFPVTQKNNFAAQNKYLNQIIEYLSDDLNTPLAFSVLHELTKLIKTANYEEKENLVNNLIQCLDFLGLYDENYLSKIKNIQLRTDIDEAYILEKINIRSKAKQQKDWGLADSIRDELLSKNIILEDLPNGETKWNIKK